jgi:hypothetical protein
MRMPYYGINPFLFIVTHHKHHCTEKECSVCEKLQLAEQILSQIKTAIKAKAALFVLIVSVYYCVRIVYIFQESNTLIKRKVRLNN